MLTAGSIVFKLIINTLTITENHNNNLKKYIFSFMRLGKVYSFELQKTLNNETNFRAGFNNYVALETNLVDHFNSAKSKNQNFREGHLKTSFIYLLIDPRISANLPGVSKVS